MADLVEIDWESDKDGLSQGVLYLKSRWWINHPDDDESNNIMPHEDIDPDDIDQLDSSECGIYG